jgi:hypothetical protein
MHSANLLLLLLLLLLLQAAGAHRVVVLDWDVHHGNGSAAIFEEDPSVLYISLHRWEGGVGGAQVRVAALLAGFGAADQFSWR